MERKARRADLTTSPPPSVHLVGLALRHHGMPWIAELRDGWAFEPPHPAWPLAALDRLSGGRTTFFVTHEVALSQHRADLVVWIEHGRVIECGPPGALIAKGGLYARALEHAGDGSEKRGEYALAR